LNILNIAAHPDDELLGQGGTIARHVLAGDRVTTLIVCEGSTVRYGRDVSQEIETQARSASRVLGVSDVRFLGLQEQGLDGLRLIDVARPIEQVVAEAQPEIVYTHSAADLNRDHRVLLEAVQVATRPYAAPSVREIWMCETASSTEWGGPPLLAPFHPQLYVDISGTLDLKIRAFECYEREVRPWPHPRSARALRARAEHWGSHAGLQAAEPFQLVRARRA
jgi:LmbE family N-acetylglucosaminyl deacetylase